MSAPARIELPPKLIPVFLGEADYRGAKGGRGSSKTRSFALMTAVFGYRAGMAGKTGLILCGREHLNSLEDSSLEEVKAAIRSVDSEGNLRYPWLHDYYEIGERFVRSKDGRISYTFAGLRHNLNSIKGKFRILLAWIDEAEPVSADAWDKLDATIREDGSELWVTWNPESEDSETRRRFELNPPPNSKIVELNWRDNPWFPERLNRIRLRKQAEDPARYDWEWEGKCLTRSDAQILAGKHVVEAFTPGDDWDGPYYGMDFGFSSDPTAAVKCWVHDNCLFVEHEAGKVGLELDDTLPFLRDLIPGIGSGTVRADCARPESISYLRRNGMSRCTPCSKWAGSVKDGISHLQSYRKIVVHPRCVETARECRLYSFKVDPNTGKVTDIVIDAHNHYIDAIRYALEPLIGSGLASRRSEKAAAPPERDAWGRKRSEGSSWKTA